MLDDLVPVMGVIGIFFVPVAMVILIVWFRIDHKNKRDKLRADLLVKAIENGQTIPDNLFEIKEKKNSNPLKNGIIWTAVGVGCALFFVLMGVSENNYTDALQGLGVSMIPIFVGIGFLLIHFIGKKQAKENDGDK